MLDLLRLLSIERNVDERIALNTKEIVGLQNIRSFDLRSEDSRKMTQILLLSVAEKAPLYGNFFATQERIELEKLSHDTQNLRVR